MPTILRSRCTGEDIQKVLDAVEPHLNGFPVHHVIMACFTIAIMSNKPDTTIDELKEGIKNLSQMMCMGVEMSTLPTTIN